MIDKFEDKISKLIDDASPKFDFSEQGHFDKFDEEISRIVNTTAAELNKTQDHYIFDFFGSIEKFMEVGHLYVLEEFPVEMSRIEFEGFGDADSTTIRFEQRFRLRLKTEEELEMEKLNPPRVATRKELEQAWRTVERNRQEE